MPLTQLDPIAALIVIDLQKGIVAMPLAQPVVEIVARCSELARAFRERGLPVVLVSVTAAAPGRTDAGPHSLAGFPPDWSELVPELASQSSDILIRKQRVGAFIGTSLDETLRERGVSLVFLAGIATSGGVESTVRSARDYGYNVVTVTDAMADRSAEAQRHCVENVFPRLSETTTTAAVLQMMGAQDHAPGTASNAGSTRRS